MRYLQLSEKKKKTNAGGMGTLEIDGAIEGNLSNRFRIKFQRRKRLLGSQFTVVDTCKVITFLYWVWD